MALAKKNGILGGMVDTFRNCAAAVGLSALALTGCGSDANSADNQQAANSVPAGWNAESWELNLADLAATEFAAKTENGVGMLLHIGDDLRARAQQEADFHGVDYEVAMNAMIAKIEESYAADFAQYGVEAEIFPTNNIGGRATGMTYHIGSQIYEDRKGNPLLNLKRARQEIPNVIEALQVVKQLAQYDADKPQPDAFGG